MAFSRSNDRSDSFSNSCFGPSSSGSQRSISDETRADATYSNPAVFVSSGPEGYLISGVDPDSYAIYASVSGVRIYHSMNSSGSTTKKNGNSIFGRSRSRTRDQPAWNYSHLKGTLLFGQEKNPMSYGRALHDEMALLGHESDGYWFQLVDESTGRTVWKFNIPLLEGKFMYEVDRPFFHIFQGSSRKYGFLFNDDKEATTFSKDVMDRIDAATPAANALQSKPRHGRPRSLSSKSYKSRSPPSSPVPPVPPLPSRSNTTGTTSSPAISSPNPSSFQHVAHIGLNPVTGALKASDNMDPAFRAMLAELRRGGIGRSNIDFVQRFWKGTDMIQRSQSGRAVAAN